MTKKAVRVQDLDDYQEGQGAEQQAMIARRELLESLANSFKDKTFADLTTEEKDELLRAVAIKLRLIEE